MSTNQSAQDLSWTDSPMRPLLKLAWPMVISWLSFSTMTLVDTLFLGWDGPASLAGVGLAGIAAWMIICFPWGLLQGAKSLVSQAIGAGQEHEVGAYFSTALIWALGLSAAAIGLGYLVAMALPALAASAEAGAAADGYLRIRLLGLPAFFAFCAMREVRQGVGDSRTPMIASLSANLANIGLDYLFIVHWGGGAAGAATATALSNLVEATLMMGILARERFWPGALSARHLAALWRIGWPSGGHMLIEMGCFSLLSAMISKYSELHMAAHQIAIQVIHFSFLPAMALGEAAAVLAGQAVGARRDHQVYQVARAAMLLAGVYTGACALVLVIGGRWIAGAFSDQPALVDLTVTLLLIAALFQVFDAVNMIARCILRGVGDVRYPAVVGTLVAWALTPPSMWLLGYGLGLGAVGGWIGLSAELMLVAVLFWWRLRQGKWRVAAEKIRTMRESIAATSSVEEPSPAVAATHETP